jgi:hypothetical protein
MNESSPTEEQLEKQGWKFATLSGGDHLQRTLEMYSELGIETYLYKVVPGKCGECTACYEQGGEELYRIYVKTSNK